MKKLLFSFRLIAVILLCTTLCSSAFAAGAVETAADYLVNQGIFVGDESGNLNPDQSLTRAELAVILTRLDFMAAPDDWLLWGKERFSDPATRINPFADLPIWALPYIEYCYQRGLMKGVDETQFDPQGQVNPKMACTVMLRYCGIAESDWSYQTSVAKAQSIGIAPKDGMDAGLILRGAMAVIIHRGILFCETNELSSEPTDTTQPPTPDQPNEPETSAPAMSIDEMKAEVVRLMNEERSKAGLPELEVFPELMDCAQAKAQDFQDNEYYGHTSPVYGTPLQMVLSYGMDARACNEVIAPGRATAEATMNAWIESEPHRTLIVDAALTHVGVGILPTKNNNYMWVMQMIALR